MTYWPKRLQFYFVVFGGALVNSALAAANSAVLPAMQVPAGGTNIPIARFLSATPLTNPAVRVLSSEGQFDMQLLPESAPATVTNFLRYVDGGRYANLIVHRSDPGFVIQTGAITLQGDGLGYVPLFPTVTNEFGLSNLRGTAAMAKMDGDPNSATSQWFINLSNNAFLDAANGGFTVFARVIGGGMSNVDRIASLPVYNKTDISFELGELPLKDHSGGAIQLASLIMISNVVRLPWALSSDLNAVTAEVVGNSVRVKFRGFPSNSVSVSVHSYDRATNPRVASLPVTAPSQKFTGLLQRSNGTFPTLAALSVAPSGTFSGSLANRTGTAQISSSQLKQQFLLTNPTTGVLFRSLGESVVYWYGHADAAFFALNFTNTSSAFTNTLTGALMPAAYSGAGADACPLAGRIYNAVLIRTNQSLRQVSGFLQLAFDKAGTVTVSGVFPDNRSASASSFIALEPWTGQQLIPLGIFDRKGQAVSLTGTLRLPSPIVATSPVVGAMNWTAGTNAASAFDLLATVWTNRPGTNVISGDTNTASCVLRIPGIPDQNLLWGPDNKPRFSPTNGMTIRFDARKGTFAGDATVVATNGKRSKVPYKGVVFSSVPPGLDSGVRGYGLAALPGTNGPAPVMLVRP